jgi:hypothetical protein
MSRREENLQFNYVMEDSQFQRVTAKGQARKRWEVDSWAAPQRLHTEGKCKPLLMRFSSVGSFSCNNLQTKRDLEGGMETCHMILAQCKWCGWEIWNLYASLNDRFPSCEGFQIFYLHCKTLEWLLAEASDAVEGKHLRKPVEHSICDSANKLRYLIAEGDVNEQECLKL